ncbi:MAG: N-acetyltransferase [Bacteroidia bacterium]|nr:N-acetyltransferase [Bacteroidia bacterium]
MDIQREQKDQKGAFFVERDGRRLAEMTFVMTGANKFIIDHTEVSDELRGQGIGQQLVESAVAYARENHMKIIPLCPFANSVFKNIRICRMY